MYSYLAMLAHRADALMCRVCVSVCHGSILVNTRTFLTLIRLVFY